MLIFKLDIFAAQTWKGRQMAHMAGQYSYLSISIPSRFASPPHGGVTLNSLQGNLRGLDKLRRGNVVFGAILLTAAPNNRVYCQPRTGKKNHAWPTDKLETRQRQTSSLAWCSWVLCLGPIRSALCHQGSWGPVQCDLPEIPGKF
ncbi:hypothetical protein ABW19_dt0204908 [Dactylella cylindrospora]|nr:hypothetical protein ABW19_dt0204908 [Dactylella cylindrospora]